ncbi:MAG: hypothetical protein K9G39_09005 [Chlorobium sp.]|nr:hypothetical protein [Chlorobium sp.]
MKYLKAIALSAAISLATAANTQCEVSSRGTADISANIPEFIILHYYSSLSLNFATPESEALDEGSSSLNVTWKGDASGGEELAASNLMGAKMELDGTSTTVRMPNVWAVRGFSKNGTASVTASIPSGKGTLSNGESKIGISNVQVSDNSNTGGTITTALNGIARSKATVGSILMDLDFSRTNRSGTHSGGQYTITASTM